MRIENNCITCNGDDDLEDDGRTLHINIEDDEEFQDRWKYLMGYFVNTIFSEMAAEIQTRVIEDTFDKFYREYQALPYMEDSDGPFKNIGPIVGPLVLSYLVKEMNSGALRADARLATLMCEFYNPNIYFTHEDIVQNVLRELGDLQWIYTDNVQYRCMINFDMVKSQIGELIHAEC